MSLRNVLRQSSPVPRGQLSLFEISLEFVTLVFAMLLSDLLARGSHYAKRHGIRAALARACLSLKREADGRSFVLFYCDLRNCRFSGIDSFSTGRVERRLTQHELQTDELQQILNAWNSKVMRRQIAERFNLGASLWLLKSDDEVAGYGWSILGRTIEPHFLPLARNDAHLFDYFVFPKCRGRRINPALVNHVLAQLASETDGRAYIEAAEWNHPQLSSLRRTPFLLLGRASKHRLFGRTVVTWSSEKASTNAPESPV